MHAPRHACIRIQQLFASCFVSLFLCFFGDVAFVSSLHGEYGVRFFPPLQDGALFYLMTMGWIFIINLLCEIESINNQGRKLLMGFNHVFRWLPHKLTINRIISERKPSFVIAQEFWHYFLLFYHTESDNSRPRRTQENHTLILLGTPFHVSTLFFQLMDQPTRY